MKGLYGIESLRGDLPIDMDQRERTRARAWWALCSRPPTWVVLALFSVGLGLLLWLMDSTNVSLLGTIPDIVFPPAVGLIGLISWGMAKHAPTKVMRRVVRLLSLPSVVGASLYVLMGVLLFVPPFTLGAIFTMMEIADEKCLQQAISPNGAWVAKVRFRGVGAYAGGNGRVLVVASPSLLPVLEQDVYYVGASYAHSDTTDYVTWVADDELYVSEAKERVTVGKLRWHIPQVIQIPLNVGRLLIALSEDARRERELSVPVSDVPIYDGVVTHDQSQYNEVRGTAFRSFNVPDSNPDDLVAWYKQALSESPWSLIRVDRQVVEESDVTHVRYCMQAQRQVSDVVVIYYWEFMGRDDGLNGVHVNIGTPNPITDTCARYLDE